MRGVGEEPLSLADHMCLLCCQELAATSGNISARPTTAASTTNVLMTACAWKVSPGSRRGTAPSPPCSRNHETFVVQQALQ